jgi:short-subunit dehydrogenase
MGEFADRYGPWGVVFGASEGIGASFARRVAAQKVNVVLVARRLEPLRALADEIRTTSGVEARIVGVDLRSSDFLDDVRQVSVDLDIGLIVWNVGATVSADRAHEAGEFLGTPVESHLGLVRLNCIGPVAACREFAPRMVDRGRGGVVLVGSMAGTAGAALTVTYSASKAFEQVLAEGLWSELEPRGVDVLALVAGATSTPALERSGVMLDPSYPPMTADDVVSEGLAHLADGPVWVPGDTNRAGFEYLRSLTRREATETMSAGARGLWRHDR